MVTSLNFVLFFLGVSSAIKLAKYRGVGDVKIMMQSAPMDFNVQAKGCEDLSKSTEIDRKDPGAYGGMKIAKHWLEEGYGEIVSQGLLNILANQAPPEDTFPAARTCFQAILAAQVQNDRDLGLALYRNSPHLWDAFVGYFKKFKHKPEVVGGKVPLIMFAGLYGSFDGEEEVALGLDKAGGYELILDIMEENPTSAAIVQAATGALSDNVQCSQSAADAVASHDGVNRLTNAVRRAYGMEHYHDEFGFGLRYEILEDIVGLLKHDKDRKKRDAFVEAGLMEAVVKFMPEEPNDLYFQDHCCQTFNWLTNGNVMLQRRLNESGAVPLVQKAATENCAPACKWPTTMFKDGNHHPPSCIFTHQNLAGTGDWKIWYGE